MQKKLSSPLSKPSVSPRQSDPMISKLFSAEFLSNLKHQLNHKLHTPRTTNEIYTKIDQKQDRYEKEIAELKAKIKRLTLENLELKNHLSTTNSHLLTSKAESLKTKMESEIKISKLKTVPLQTIHLLSEHKNQSQTTTSLLIEKITNLQNYRTMKEKMFKQMIAKELTLHNEIKSLKYKNQQLEKSALLTHRHSKQGSIAIQVQSQETPLTKQMNYLSPKYCSNSIQRDPELVVSQTIEINLPPDIDFYPKEPATQEFTPHENNEIDELLAQQLPYIKASQLDNQYQQQTVRQNVNQSTIGIII